ncbi:MAG: hypothetical protein ABSA18_03445 [Dehalococcoidia bacterium]|jgi:hypothetical protein
MRSLWILLGLGLVISVLICCQAGNGVLPVVSYSDTGSGNTLKLNITGPVDESVVRSSPVTVSGNTEPGVDMMINGLSIAIEDGHFSVMVELEPGPNIIDISVKDTSGKQASKYLTIVYVP